MNTPINPSGLADEAHLAEQAHTAAEAPTDHHDKELEAMVTTLLKRENSGIPPNSPRTKLEHLVYKLLVNDGLPHPDTPSSPSDSNSENLDHAEKIATPPPNYHHISSSHISGRRGMKRLSDTMKAMSDLKRFAPASLEWTATTSKPSPLAKPKNELIHKVLDQLRSQGPQPLDLVNNLYQQWLKGNYPKTSAVLEEACDWKIQLERALLAPINSRLKYLLDTLPKEHKRYDTWLQQVKKELSHLASCDSLSQFLIAYMAIGIRSRTAGRLALEAIGNQEQLEALTQFARNPSPSAIMEAFVEQNSDYIAQELGKQVYPIPATQRERDDLDVLRKANLVTWQEIKGMAQQTRRNAEEPYLSQVLQTISVNSFAPAATIVQSLLGLQQEPTYRLAHAKEQSSPAIKIHSPEAFTAVVRKAMVLHHMIGGEEVPVATLDVRWQLNWHEDKLTATLQLGLTFTSHTLPKERAKLLKAWRMNDIVRGEENRHFLAMERDTYSFSKSPGT